MFSIQSADKNADKNTDKDAEKNPEESADKNADKNDARAAPVKPKKKISFQQFANQQKSSEVEDGAAASVGGRASGVKASPSGGIDAGVGIDTSNGIGAGVGIIASVGTAGTTSHSSFVDLPTVS